jgi:hypothetical protein
MFVKITTSAGRRYVKLVEAFRDDRGVPCQRVIATLGRLEAVRAGVTVQSAPLLTQAVQI